ncbi:MAG: EAL domain-containing protein [Proteobacteria bacterium]|nr:EAL domain-containing protein [Pseudomonadota bacterium]
MTRFALPPIDEVTSLLDAGVDALIQGGQSQAQARSQRLLAQGAIDALRNGTVKFVTLPVLNSRTGTELFSEMLLRIFDDAGKPLPVFDSLMAVQDLKLFPKVIPYLLVEQLTHVHRLGRHISINVPPALLRDGPHRDRVAEVLRHYEQMGGDPAYVILEITETEYLPANMALVDFMDTLKEQGYRWALDDYGDGHHTLEHVRKLPLDFVKLSEHVVERFLDPDPHEQEELLAICDDRQLTLIAEHTPSLAAAEKLFQEFGIIYVNMAAPEALGNV